MSRRRRCGCSSPAGRRKASRITRSIFAHDPDAFPEPKWPTQSLGELIEKTFARPHDRSRRSPGFVAFDRLRGRCWGEQTFHLESLSATSNMKSQAATDLVAAIYPSTLHGGVRAGFQIFSTCAPSAFGAVSSAAAPPFDIGPDTSLCRLQRLGRADLLHGVGLEISRSTSSICIPPIWRQAIFCCPTIRMKCANDSASDLA